MTRARASRRIRTARAMPALVCLTVLLSCGGEPTTPSVAPPPVAPPAQPEIPISGAAVAGLEPFDQRVRDLMRKYGMPGGAIALVRDGRLFYARGFGYADVEDKTPVAPDALFRIASVSKSLTSAAVMTLVEAGRLRLDDRVAPYIAHLAPAPGATVDPRWERITIRHLLNHSAGWDRAKPNGGFDPMDRPLIAAAAVGAPAPASAETLIRYMKGMPLDFDPGGRFAYSNFGYCILGRVIERVSGMRYEDFVRTRVLQPVGANRTRSGRSRLADALPDEVRYYSTGAPLNSPLVPSVFPGEGTVPVNYGGYHLEAMDASGAWVSSTIDLLRFVGGVDGRTDRADILSAGIVAEMNGSGATVCPDGTCYYGAGWFVRPVQGGATWWHGGDLPGTKAMLVRSYYDLSWVALFNTAAPSGLITELEAALWDTLGSVASLPTHDLFPTFR